MVDQRRKDRMQQRAATRRPIARSGLVLVLVLAFAALAAITGMAVMDSSFSAYPEALNLRAAARARNLASSGIAMAAHYLRVPPTTVTVGNYWTGTTGYSIDGTSDTVDVTVTRSAASLENFVVTATGVARNADATIRGKRTLTTEIVTPPPYAWTLTRAYTSSTTPTFSNSVNFYGDVHANGNISSGAYSNGTVSATGSISWTNLLQPPAKIPNAAAVAMPPLDPTMYTRYVVNGIVRAAQPYGSGNTTLTSSAITALGGTSSLTVLYQSGGIATIVDTVGTVGGAVGLGSVVQVVTSLTGLSGTQRTGASLINGNNPGGVLVTSGDLDMTADMAFIGTLVVNGKLKIRTNVTGGFYAMPGYPALIVTSNIQLDSGATVEVFGPVQYAGIYTGTYPKLTQNGPVLNYGTGFDTTFGNNLFAVRDFRWSADYQKFYVFSLSPVQPMTFLKWSE